MKAEVRKAFLDCKIPDYLNQTNVVLIPKMAGPESLGNYRPIRSEEHTSEPQSPA